MACGYQMAGHMLANSIEAESPLLGADLLEADWPFARMLAEITSTAPSTPGRAALLADLLSGEHVHALDAGAHG